MNFRQVDVCLGDGDGGPDIVALGNIVGKHIGHAGAPGIDRNDLVCAAPLGIGTNQVSGCSIGQVGLVVFQQGAGGDRQRTINAVTAAVSANDVALAAVGALTTKSTQIH